MKKYFSRFLFFTIIMLFIAPLSVKANFGDLRYEITSVNISGSNITFKGWAYIHRTNNFTTVTTADGNTTIKSGGDQKILMQAYSGSTLIETVSTSGSSATNYNFYCELFFKGTYSCVESSYKSSVVNDCVNDTDGTGKGQSQCYYEDMYFEITFDTSEWNVSESSTISFKIAVSNADFESKKDSYSNEYLYAGDYYTNPENVSIAAASVSNLSNDYIIINRDSLSSDVEFIAVTGLLLSPTSGSLFSYDGSGVDCAYGVWKNGSSSYVACNSNIYQLISTSNYPNGRSSSPSTDRCYDFLGSDCKGTNSFAIKVNKSYTNVGYVCSFACPNNSNDSSKYTIAIARGSHVKPVGKFTMNIKNDKKCEIDAPNLDHLYCNSSGTLSSTCDELTVHTDKGSVIVKIEQTGTISSVLTPERIYAGGGFSFGIMYFNTVKWSYVGGTPSDSELMSAVEAQMQQKIKDYNSYVAGLNISELSLGGVNYGSNFLVKNCTTSNSSDKYYNSQLTVSCIFYFPDSDLLRTGEVNYINGASGFGISNKFYTALNYSGPFEVEAKIVGMDRITEDSSVGDSAVVNQKWTGTWEDTFENCSIVVYSLLYNPGGDFNFIYRPIDIYNPFPGRIAGVNWYDWYNLEANKDRLEATYSSNETKLQYSITMDNQTIASIKQYNDSQSSGYFDWNTMNGEKSTFIDEYFTEINRNNIVGDNS